LRNGFLRVVFIRIQSHYHQILDNEREWTLSTIDRTLLRVLLNSTHSSPVAACHPLQSRNTLALEQCVLHYSGTILDVAEAVFHGSFESAEQSYASLPRCSIAFNATMPTADKGRR
jgi:hypothetical protein